MHIEYEQDYDRKLERRRMRATGSNWVRSGIGLAVGFLVAAGIAAAAWYHSQSAAALALAILLAAIAINFVYAPWAQERQALVSRELEHEGRTRTEITDEHVGVASEHSSHIVRWTLVMHVMDRDRFWVGRSNSGSVVFVLPQELMTPSQVSELRSFLVVRGLLPELYKV